MVHCQLDQTLVYVEHVEAAEFGGAESQSLLL